MNFTDSGYIDDKKQDTYTKEISLINVKYLIEELARIHEFEIEYSGKLVDRFVFHEK